MLIVPYAFLRKNKSPLLQLKTFRLIGYFLTDLLFDYSVKDRISALKQENERLKQEADKHKSELEYWEVRNGCKYRCSRHIQL